MSEPVSGSRESTTPWEAYKWPQVEMRWSGEDAAFLCRWREFPSCVVDGPSREDAFGALVSLTPTLMLTFADVPHADVRDVAQVALARTNDLEKRVESLEALLNPVIPHEQQRSK